MSAPLPTKADVVARLGELKALESGWLWGDGTAFDAAGLDRLAALFTEHYPEYLPMPSVGPVPPNLVGLEWSPKVGTCAGSGLGQHYPSLEIDLTTMVGDWHDMHMGSKECESYVVDLSRAEGWAWVALKIGAMAAEAITEPGHLEPATFGWTESGAKVREAVREFSGSAMGEEGEQITEADLAAILEVAKTTPAVVERLRADPVRLPEIQGHDDHVVAEPVEVNMADFLDPPSLEWTEADYRAAEAAREFGESVTGTTGGDHL